MPAGSFHIVASVCVAASTGRVLVSRRAEGKEYPLAWEFPAGSVDKGETPEKAAVRECHEEIGKLPSTVVRLSSLYPTPGYCDEEMVFFRVSGLEQASEPAAVDEDEDIEAREFELREAREMVRRGEIVDMKTIIGLGLL